MRFAELTAPEIRALDRDTTLVVAPLAACEQHSDHLPVYTDSILCGAVADGLERELPDRVLLLPVLWLGASEHHAPFGGTLTATLPTYEAILVELLGSLLRQGFYRFLLLNGHGGNDDPARVALRRLDTQYPGRILTFARYWGLAELEFAALAQGPLKSVGHACEIETAMMLAVRPDLVRRQHVRDDSRDDEHPLPHGLFWARDFTRRTHRGAIGYPESATPDSGRAFLDAAIRKASETARWLLTRPSEFASPE
jgi:creatinine amidohydrolase